jgi:ribonuclease T2
MQFDQKTLFRVGAALVILAVAASFGQLGGGSSAPPTTVVEPSTAELKPDAASAESAPVAAPAQAASVSVSTGNFDYYVLVLSWSPTHCSSDEGRGRDDDLQCRSGRPFGFVVHGLWPQHERGWPQFCSTAGPREVSDALVDEMLAIMPSERLIQHQWTKHGTCAGLSQDDYFAAAQLAREAVRVPKAYNTPARPLVTTANDVKRAFLDANPTWPDDGISATCSRSQLDEVWVCLDKGLRPRSCSAEVRKKHCGGREVRMLSVRGDWPR